MVLLALTALVLLPVKSPNRHLQDPIFGLADKTYAAQASVGEKRLVHIFDHGLQVPIASFLIPHHWTLDQDIAHDPGTGFVSRYRLHLKGPREQQIREFAGQFPYGTINRMPFEVALRQAIDHVLGPEKLSEVQLAHTLRGPNYGSGAPSLPHQLTELGHSFDTLSIDFAAQRNYQPYKGRIYFLHCKSSAGDFGLLQPKRLLIAPEGDFPAVEQTDALIQSSRIVSPSHRRAMAQVRLEVRMPTGSTARMLQLTTMAYVARMADLAAFSYYTAHSTEDFAANLEISGLRDRESNTTTSLEATGGAVSPLVPVSLQARRHVAGFE